MSQNTINGEVLIVTTSGAIRHDGSINDVKDGKAVFKGGRTYNLGDDDLIVRRLGSNDLVKLEPNTPVLLCKKWGCGGEFIHRGFFTKALSDRRFCFASRKDEEARLMNIRDYGSGMYQVLWQHVPNPNQPAVIIMNTSGMVLRDGRLKSLDGAQLVFTNDAKHQLTSDQLLITRIGADELESLAKDSPMVLVVPYGCGGRELFHGFFSGFVGDQRFRFAKKKGEEGRELNLSDYPRGAFRVLWAN